MKKVLKISLGILFLILLIGTFVFLWNKTRPVKEVYAIVKPHIDTKNGQSPPAKSNPGTRC